MPAFSGTRETTHASMLPYSSGSGRDHSLSTRVPETSALSCARWLYAETPSTTSALATRPIARARRINLETLPARDPAVNACLPAIVACQCARPPVRGAAVTSVAWAFAQPARG